MRIVIGKTAFNAKCLWCGKRAPVTDESLDVIFTILRYADLSTDQFPCLELPEEARDGLRFLSKYHIVISS